MDTNTGIGFRYLQETRYDREQMFGGLREQYPRSPLYKTYPPEVERVSLPPPDPDRRGDFWQSVAQRRSHRHYQDAPISLSDLGALLWAAQGVTLALPHYAFRAAPSAGALYPVETYAAIHRVEGVDSGIWHFQVQEFSLVCIAKGDVRREVVLAGLNQDFLGTAAAVFIWTGILGRALWKYRQRAVRYLFMDAGHICGNLQLAATAMGLGCCPVAAFFDEEVERLVHVDPKEEIAVYMAAVGRISREP